MQKNKFEVSKVTHVNLGKLGIEKSNELKKAVVQLISMVKTNTETMMVNL